MISLIDSCKIWNWKLGREHLAMSEKKNEWRQDIVVLCDRWLRVDNRSENIKLVYIEREKMNGEL